jgi:hypothetical protein
MQRHDTEFGCVYRGEFTQPAIRLSWMVSEMHEKLGLEPFDCETIPPKDYNRHVAEVLRRLADEIEATEDRFVSGVDVSLHHFAEDWISASASLIDVM